MSRFASSSGRRGSISVEFGLVAATLIVAMLACIDIGRYVATRTALRAAVGEVVRAAMTDVALNACTAPETLALGRVALLDAALLSVCLQRTATTVTVNASYSFSFITPLFGAKARNLAASASTPL